ncbi:LysE family translocator [Tsukamurella sp. 8F]|uniref:LysE family translocator n=1 Tax=unclassified Tsukamurella TaxID=2633480 RepID=UPI0023BA3D0B|nr:MULTISPECIES: LysE family translocator [unclassified Tsukamurella]MDF0530183.1 LysE family translocator [Tsukamurella sp. 8J]MDF0586500.1 LysE family translocator [Tsukamurella sp. 8F]
MNHHLLAALPVSPAGLLAFGLTALVIIVAPGPSVLFVVGRALAHGRTVAIASALGGTLGSLALCGLVVSGLGTLIAASAVVFTTAKVIGAIYLCYLGIQAIRHRRRLSIGGTRAFPAQERGVVLRSARQGFVVGVSNPKTLVFFGAVLPQFVDAGRGHPATQMAVFALLFCMLAALSDSVWALAAGTARNWFARSDRRLRAVGGAGGVAMIGLGVGLAVTGRAD